MCLSFGRLEVIPDRGSEFLLIISSDLDHSASYEVHIGIADLFNVDRAGRALQRDHFSLVLLSAICGALLQCRLYTWRNTYS